MRFASNCYEKAEKLTDRSDRVKGECLLWGVKRTLGGLVAMSAYDGEFNRSLQHCSPELSGVALEQFLYREPRS